MEDIVIEPFEIWEYYEDHIERLKEYRHLIASNEELGRKVWITVENFELTITVEEDDDEIYREYIVDENEAEEIVDSIYDIYIRDEFVIDSEYGENNEFLKQEDIYYRESDLDIAVTDFLSAVCGDDFEVGKAMINDIKEHSLEYLARKWGVEIYRPMFLKDVDTGEIYFTEYPYEDMVFDE